MSHVMIQAEGLKKRFGSVEALKGVDLEVEAGTVLGLLGPNGAGKTTAVRILTTLLTPDEGRASVAGYDVIRDAERLRRSIGLAGQFAAIDQNLSGFENLEMVGRLYHLGSATAKARADEVLERFGLSDAAHRIARTYSGGMRRRLDLGASLVGHPEVLFLDEPTTGLDPRSRFGLWDLIRELVSDGTTLLLTTQYLEEADVLADRIAVIDQGSVIAEGTADELKRQSGGAVLELTVADRALTEDAVRALLGLGTGDTKSAQETGEIKVPVGFEGSTALVEAVRRLDGANVPIADLALHRPTLDDVFLSLTGHGADELPGDQDLEPAAGGRGRAARSGA
jgi:ABC-2 type transport system ATP-binding protein